MKLSCKIIQDLLLLYTDDACSQESRTAVEEHLAHCPACRRHMEALKLPEAMAEPIPEPDPIDDITYVNVLQALVEDRVDKYMKQFKMCDCHRCRTDVVALALTSLPAKYIVVPEHESVPMLSIYESRYSAAVTAQLIAACQKVAEHPRHSDGHDGRLRLGAPRNDE